MKNIAGILFGLYILFYIFEYYIYLDYIYICWGRSERLQYPLPFHYHGLSPHLFISLGKPLVAFFFGSFVQLVASLSVYFL